MSVRFRKRGAFCSLMAVVAISAAAMGGGQRAFADAGHGQADIGKPGKAGAATRTINIVMSDNLYEPESLEVKAGETVRFVLKNEGELLHEFNIGTAAMHADHQKEMAMMVDHGMLTPTAMVDPSKMDHSKMGGMDMTSMKHDDSNSKLVEPGKTAELVWTFPKNAKLEFACNIPGHYESGMVGAIRYRN